MIYYFGYRGDGHFLYRQDSSLTCREHLLPAGFPVSITALDGQMLPMKSSQIQSQGQFFHIGGYTIFTFWDRSGDKRHGSNSAFIADSVVTMEKLCYLFAEAFPDVWKRIPKPLHLYT